MERFNPILFMIYGLLFYLRVGFQNEKVEPHFMCNLWFILLFTILFTIWVSGQELKESFAKLDVNGDGSISRKEFVNVRPELNFEYIRNSLKPITSPLII